MSVKERQILFSDDMVRAILEGRKSQTRRVIKGVLPNNRIRVKNKTIDSFVHVVDAANYGPYGKPGDFLWVRETWRLSPDACEGWPTDAKPCPGFIDYRSDNSSLERFAPDFAAIERLTTGRDPDWDWDNPPYAWKSPIHMPRWASRIRLEITGIRVEPLQDISADDAIAEGIDRVSDAPYWAWKDYLGHGQLLSPNMSYQTLWDSINSNRGYPWEYNPWVRVIEFRRAEQ